MMISLASMTVPTPTVSAIFGTREMSLLKNRELAMIVSYALVSQGIQESTSVLIRVREVRLLRGSLNAMCPSGPMPEIRIELSSDDLRAIIRFHRLYGFLLRIFHILFPSSLHFHRGCEHS